MPINLKYGHKAVERGYITPQRLQQVLAKQRQLGAQGKKVSVRMILEKAKLLSTEQLAQVDAALNIKVVKKQTGRLAQAPAPAPAPLAADPFVGEAVPEFSGMSGGQVDATLFEPPPPDMKDRIRAERDKAKEASRMRQEADAAAFFEQNESNPFGGDPFAATGEMAPEPLEGEMQPEMAPDPYMGEGAAEPAPMEASAQMDDGGLMPEPMADEGMAELDRMDSSPKLTSLQAEVSGFASPDEEELPSLDANFMQAPAPPMRRQGSGRAFAPIPSPPAHSDLAPHAGEFEAFGNDIISPEALEAGTRPLGSSPNVDRTMFSPPPAGIAGREKTGAMDRTVFSPRPAGFGPARPPEPEEPASAWGESAPGMGEGDDPSAATVFSPPPPDVQARPGASQKKPSGRSGAADFANIEMPMGKRMDDIPTAPATGEDVHPLRRSLTSAQPKGGHFGPPSQEVQAMSDVDQELPMDDPSDMLKLREGPVVKQPPGARDPAKIAKAEAAATKERDKFPPMIGRKADKGRPAEASRSMPSKKKKKKERRGTPRVWLFFLFFVIVALAILVLPVALQDQVAEMKALRKHEATSLLYDEVETVYDWAFRQIGLEVPKREGKKPPPKPREKSPAAGNEASNALLPDNTPVPFPPDNSPAE